MRDIFDNFRCFLLSTFKLKPSLYLGCDQKSHVAHSGIHFVDTVDIAKLYHLGIFVGPPSVPAHQSAYHQFETARVQKTFATQISFANIADKF